MNLQARIVVMSLTALTLKAQWVHRYPQVTGLAHHIYLEGYELPGVAHGCLDPAPAPNGKHLYFTGMGWIWRLDLQSGEASRTTQGPACDSRPAVSRDGKQLVFLRDDTHTVWIVMKDLATGRERELVRSGKLDLDPVFTADGQEVMYASSETGDLNLWRVDLASGQRRRPPHGHRLPWVFELASQPEGDGFHPPPGAPGNPRQWEGGVDPEAHGDGRFCSIHGQPGASPGWLGRVQGLG
jgi:TolB protein